MCNHGRFIGIRNNPDISPRYRLSACLASSALLCSMQPHPRARYYSWDFPTWSPPTKNLQAVANWEDQVGEVGGSVDCLHLTQAEQEKRENTRLRNIHHSDVDKNWKNQIVWIHADSCRLKTVIVALSPGPLTQLFNVVR